MPAQDPAPEETAPRQARAQRTRQHILDLAAAAFAEGGYDGTALNEIVRGSGLTKGAFYFHFASKEDLAFAVFDHVQQRFVEALAREARAAADGLSAIAAIFRGRARLMATEPSFGVILRLGGRLSSMARPDSAYARNSRRPIDTLTEVVRRGQEDGGIRPDLDPRRAAEAIFAAILGIDEASGILSGGGDLARRTEDMLDLLERGLAAPRPAKRRRPGPARRASAGDGRGRRA